MTFVRRPTINRWWIRARLCDHPARSHHIAKEKGKVAHHPIRRHPDGGLPSNLNNGILPHGSIIAVIRLLHHNFIRSSILAASCFATCKRRLWQNGVLSLIWTHLHSTSKMTMHILLLQRPRLIQSYAESSWFVEFSRCIDNHDLLQLCQRHATIPIAITILSVSDAGILL